jgi:hypothetical protein
MRPAKLQEFNGRTSAGMTALPVFQVREKQQIKSRASIVGFAVDRGRRTATGC